MASASGCSITGQSTFHQPTVLRRAEKPTRRCRSPGTPVPERVSRPPASSCHTQLRRTPRYNTAGLPQDVCPFDESLLRPTRRSRQIPGTKTLPSISSVALRHDESPRKRYHSPTHNVQDLRPTISRRDPSTIPSNIGMTRSSLFPPRRTRKAPSSEEGYRKPEYHKDNERMANPYYPKHSTTGLEIHPYSCDSPVTPPMARRVRTIDPTSPASNRWSLSSDSSVSSAWSSSSSMICPPTPTSDDAYATRSRLYGREADYSWELEHAQREKELWRLRCLQMEDVLGWAAERSPFIGSDDYQAPVYNDPSNIQEPLIDYQAPVYNDPSNIQEPLIDNSNSFLSDGDAGQTTVYTNCEVIAHDASFRRQIRNVDGVYVTHSSATNLRKKSKSRRVDDIEWEKGEEQRRKKRARPFPMWAEAVPREMRRKEKDGITIRFVPEPDDSCPVPGIRHVTVHKQLGLPHDHLPPQATSRRNSIKPNQTLSLLRKSC